MISIFKDLNQLAKKSKYLDFLGIFLARFFPFILVIFLLFYSVYKVNYKLFILSIISGLFGLFINKIIRFVYKEKRPAYLNDARVLIPVPKDFSFPSGHTSFFFGISFLLLIHNFYIGLIFIIFSFLIGIARVFCGVHYFKDILAGIVVGFISSQIIYNLLLI